MTGQIPDTFVYRHSKYELIGIKGDGLIVPQDYGMEPTMMHTACYRGFFSTYTIADEGLFLTEMTVYCADSQYGPIDGVMPETGKDPEDRVAVYRGLHVLAPFTGTLRLGKGFIREFYVHMGFQKPSAFKTVIDFHFESGRLISKTDLSAKAARKRGAFHDRFGSGNMIQSIEDAFSLDIDEEEIE